MYKAIKSNGGIKEVRHKDETIWKLDTKPKVFIFGDLNGIRTDDIEACIKTTEYEIVGKDNIDQTTNPVVEIAHQNAVLEAYKKSTNIIIVLGFSEEESCIIYAGTFKDGDPTWSGPLGGIQLNLKTYHICEPEIKNKIDPKVYEEHNMETMEMVIDVEGIHNELKAIRGES